MSTLIKSYEQQYSVLTAEITAKIARLKTAHEDDRDQLVQDIQTNFEEANDLLEQLELESRGSSGRSRVAAYRAELQRVRAEFRAVLSNSATYNIDPDEYEDWSMVNEQRQKLLNNSERLERSGRGLAQGYRAALESEQVGAAVLQDLHMQRETIQRSRSRVRETDEQLSRSGRLVNNMVARGLQQRAALAGMLLLLAGLAALGAYHVFS